MGNDNSYIPIADHFRLFAKRLSQEIKNVKTDTTQKKQIDSLVSLERKFRKELCSHRAGQKVYEDFISFIIDEKKNILSARPYFRERQKTFSVRISPALKKRNAKALHKFSFNYLFISFALKVYGGRGVHRKMLFSLAERIKSERDSLITRNLPLAINRAKLFWNKIPKIDKDYLDYIQMASEGLISAIDKFVPPYRTVFRSVAIGRMVGNMTEASSETVMHFYPSDKRILYKANLIIHRKKKQSLEEVVTELNQDKKAVGRATRRRIDRGLEVYVQNASDGNANIQSVIVTDLCEHDRLLFWDTKVGDIMDCPGFSEPMRIVAMFEIVTVGRLCNILKGAAHISIDTKLNIILWLSDNENIAQESVSAHSCIADPVNNQAEELEKREMYDKIKQICNNELSIFERKILILKGEYYD